MPKNSTIVFDFGIHKEEFKATWSDCFEEEEEDEITDQIFFNSNDLVKNVFNKGFQPEITVYLDENPSIKSQVIFNDITSTITPIKSLEQARAQMKNTNVLIKLKTRSLTGFVVVTNDFWNEYRSQVEQINKPFCLEGEAWFNNGKDFLSTIDVSHISNDDTEALKRVFPMSENAVEPNVIVGFEDYQFYDISNFDFEVGPNMGL